MEAQCKQQWKLDLLQVPHISCLPLCLSVKVSIWENYTLGTESALTAFMVKSPKCPTVNKINLIDPSVCPPINCTVPFVFYLQTPAIPFLSRFYEIWIEKFWPLHPAICLIDAYSKATLLRKVTLGLKRKSGAIPWAKGCKCSIFICPWPARRSSRKGSTKASEHSSSQSYACSCPPSPACSLPQLSSSCLPFLPSATALHFPHLLLPRRGFLAVQA